MAHRVDLVRKWEGPGPEIEREVERPIARRLKRWGNRMLVGRW